ncbi:MAG: NAD(P)/FAD-dependent oxidoreductase [Cellvibrionaceae bacterium]
MQVPRIVVVGGGAGGMPLVTALGKRLGKRGKAGITLVDSSLTHIWKPRYHEVATGAIDANLDAIDYRAHARANHYTFQQGRLQALDRERKTICLAALRENGKGPEILPEREIAYDYLVLAMGSQGNDFNTPGVREHCLFLDSREQAERFQQRFLNLSLTVDYYDRALRIAIVGGGATGVELAAELHHAVNLLHGYGHAKLDRGKLEVTLVEAGQRILPVLNERIANSATRHLRDLGVQVATGTVINAATENSFITTAGQEIPGDMLVWAAGIKAPDCLADFGLPVNRLNQLVVNDQLLTADQSVYAIGDCASLAMGEHSFVPPRAQAALQMAKYLGKSLPARLEDKASKAFRYRDKGSLISLSEYSSVGVLMGSLGRGGNLFIEGRLARLTYISLYRLHQAALYGWPRTLLLLLAGRFNRLLRPRLKLH